MTLKGTLIGILSGLLQCLAGAYLLADPAPSHWLDLLTVKFVMAVIIFASANGFLANKSFRDSNARTRETDVTSLTESK